jgi:hypothetical protein
MLLRDLELVYQLQNKIDQYHTFTPQYLHDSNQYLRNKNNNKSRSDPNSVILRDG